MQPPSLLDFPAPSPVTHSHMPSHSLEVTEVTMFLTPVLPFVHRGPPIPPDHHDGGLIFNYFLPFTILYLSDLLPNYSLLLLLQDALLFFCHLFSSPIDYLWPKFPQQLPHCPF